MDDLDRKILSLLAQNARMPVKEIAEHVSLTSPAVSSRIHRLEADGIIGGYTVVLIDDGRVLEQNLRYMGRDRRWLERELARRGARGAEDVYLLALDESGKVYYAAMEAKSQ